MSLMPEEFYRIQKLPPYVFAVINEMCAKSRAQQMDVIDLGMGNPDGATPRPVVKKLIEEARHARNHRYSQSKGIAILRQEIVNLIESQVTLLAAQIDQTLEIFSFVLWLHAPKLSANCRVVHDAGKGDSQPLRAGGGEGNETGSSD